MTPPQTFQKFAAWLNHHLDKRGWTISDLSRESGLDRSGIQRWKSGQLRPNADNARALADTFHRPLLEVLVAAEILTPEEAAQQPIAHPDASALTDDELIEELRRRVKTAVPQPPTREERDAEPSRFGTTGQDTKRRTRRRG